MADNKTKETRFNAENPRSQAAYDRAERMYKLEVNIEDAIDHINITTDPEKVTK